MHGLICKPLHNLHNRLHGITSKNTFFEELKPTARSTSHTKLVYIKNEPGSPWNNLITYPSISI